MCSALKVLLLNYQRLSLPHAICLKQSSLASSTRACYMPILCPAPDPNMCPSPTQHPSQLKVHRRFERQLGHLSSRRELTAIPQRFANSCAIWKQPCLKRGGASAIMSWPKRSTCERRRFWLRSGTCSALRRRPERRTLASGSQKPC